MVRQCGDATGTVTEPRRCAFDPAALRCAAGTGTDSCLTQAQVRTVREFYRLNHRYQTFDFVRSKEDEYLRKDRRTMGIWESMPSSFLDALDREFVMAAPRQSLPVFPIRRISKSLRHSVTWAMFASSR